MFHKLHVLGMSDDLWDGVCRLGIMYQLNYYNDKIEGPCENHIYCVRPSSLNVVLILLL